MAVTYEYSLSADFTNATEINNDQLATEINDSKYTIVLVDGIFTTGDEILIRFESSITTDEKTAVDNIVDLYTYTAPAVPTVSNARTAIVSNSPENPGDYTNIASAFAAGEKTVYIRDGTYVETSVISVPNFGTLMGESLGGVIIALYGGYISIDGSGGVFATTGTISLATDSTTVTGIGTSFLTDADDTKFILLGTNYFEISSVETDTSLTLIEVYHGESIVNSTYILQNMHTGVHMENMIVTNLLPTGPGLFIRALRHASIESMAIEKCSPNYEFAECGDLSLSKTVCNHSPGIGMIVGNSVTMSLDVVTVFNNVSHGMALTGDNSDIFMDTCNNENNGGDGVNIIGNARNIRMSNCVSKFNVGHGIYSTSSTFNVVAAGGTIENSGLSAVTLLGPDSIVSNNLMSYNGANGIVVSDDSNITDNIVQYTTGEGIHINGSDCVVSGNNVSLSSTVGIIIKSTADNCVVTSNRVKTSTGNGLEIEAGATDNIVSSNNLKNNTGTNFVDNGTTTETLGNKV